MEYGQKLVRDKDEQTYYYDSDGDIRYCWMDAEYDFNRIIRRSTIEQVDQEQAMHMEASVEQVNILVCGWNNRRERRGLSRINFARRLLDENEWRKEKGLPICTEKFMYPDELELFSRYAGYDLRA